MAFSLCCRFAVFNSPPPHPLLNILPIPKPHNLFLPNCPPKSTKFTSLSLSLQNQYTLHSSTSSSSSMDSPPQGYRRNVGICLINPSKKIFAASRLDIPNSWQMPQGGVDEGEDPRGAAIRELREETGVSSAEVIAEVPYWLTYDFPPEVREKLKRQWGSDWKGQAQKWFLLKFTGKDEEINLLGDGTEKPEFGDWSWISPEQIVELAVDFKKPVYKEVMTVFTPYLQ
ncbi:nudix hydrolase 26, chloroplastic [Fagus crenata]